MRSYTNHEDPKAAKTHKENHFVQNRFFFERLRALRVFVVKVDHS
jgi:hypothetical protein